jgi:putative lysine/arginine/ornithine/histidine/octopine transport system permease protein
MAVDGSRLALALAWSIPLLQGLAVTLALAAASVAAGSLLGLGATLLAERAGPVLRRTLLATLALIRSLPELLIIFAAYYGSAVLLQVLLAPFGHDGFVGIGSFTAGVLALSLIHGAFAAEVFRGAFAAVPAGPLEAARALGLRSFQALLTIRLPIALRYALPGWMNLLVITLKLTPLVAAIGLEDLLRVAGEAGKSTRDYLLFYLVALAIYLVIAGAVGLAQERAEERSHKTQAL